MSVSVLFYLFFHFLDFTRKWKGFPCGLAGKESACSVGDLGSIPGLGRSPGEGKGYPLQYSGLGNSMDSSVHGVTKSWTRLSDFHFHFQMKLCWKLRRYTFISVWIQARNSFKVLAASNIQAKKEKNILNFLGEGNCSCVKCMLQKSPCRPKKCNKHIFSYENWIVVSILPWWFACKATLPGGKKKKSTWALSLHLVVSWHYNFFS